MSALKNKWDEHILIRSLTHPKKKDIAERVVHEVKDDNFTQTHTLAAFRRLRSIYDKKGKIPSWSELVNDPSLSEREQKLLRTKEVKRKRLSEKDSTVKLPRTYEDYHAVVDRVHFQSQVAGLVRIQNEITEALSGEDITRDTVDSIISKHTESMEDLKSLTHQTGTLYKLSDKAFKGTMREFYRKLKNNFFVPTGYRAFDSRNLGIPKDSYWLMAGPSGSGKSSLSLDVLIKMKRNGARVCFIPREMSTEQMLMRVSANLLGVPIVDLVKDLKTYFKPMCKAMRKFLGNDETDASCFHFYEPEIGETPDVTLNNLKAGNYDIICDDYINLASPINGKDDWTSLDAAGRYAKVYATKNQTIILYLAQLDEDSNKVRYSRALVEHASNAWLWNQGKDEIAELGYIQIIQRKARNQDPFSFKLRADLATSSFSDFVEDDYDEPEKRNYKKGNGKGKGKKGKKLHKGLDSTHDLPSDDEV